MRASDNDTFQVTERTALFVVLLEAGFNADIADYSLAHPAKLLEDCKPSVARSWCDEHFGRGKVAA